MLDPFVKTLFDHDTWATRRLLELCRTLPPEDFTRSVPLSPGSLEQLCRHLVGSMFLFADRLNRWPHLPRYIVDEPLPPELLLAEFDIAAEDLSAAVRQALAEHPLTGTLNWTNSDEGEIAPEDQVTYAVALAQMIDHGIHHRTQAMDMLQLLGRPEGTHWHPFEWDEAVRFGP
jgi:uncharacterized damage-inducible protein DinB